MGAFFLLDVRHLRKTIDIIDASVYNGIIKKGRLTDMTITKGRLVTDDWGDGVMEQVGEYWTCESIAEHYTVCIRYMDQLLSVDKAYFPDWLQRHHLYMEDEAPQTPPMWYLRASDPFDVGFDEPWDVE